MDLLRRRRRPVAAAAMLVSLIAGCAGDTAPVVGPVKLLVTNATCASGACSTVRVLAFPDTQPHTPGGLWSLDLGTVGTASACLTIPASAMAGVTDASTGATTTYTWTTSRKLSIGSIGEGQSVVMASPSTGQFVPASHAGWSVTLPGSATPRSNEACR